MANVKLENIVKEYSDVVAVDDMNLDIRDGEFVTFVGPSGCGKSTTMEIIAGLTKPTDGTVKIAGDDVTTTPPKDRGVSMIFQNIALFPHMDVYENVSFGLRLRDYPKEEIDRKVDEALETVKLEGMQDRSPDELSGGQRQRVAIARAIVRDPDVFLMDEPLANLDAKLRVHMRTELQRLHKTLGRTTIYVTHDQAEAMTMSDRIAVMNDGQLQQIAPPLDCYNRPNNVFVAGFIGSPSMNFFQGTVDGSRLMTEHFSVDASAVDDLDQDQSVIVGVRPEDVYLVETADSVADRSDSITARTDVLEPMGAEIFTYLTFDDSPDATMSDIDPEGDSGVEGVRSDDELLMSVAPDTDIDEEDTVEVVLDRSQVHVFDADTGEALAHGVSARPEAETAVSTEENVESGA